MPDDPENAEVAHRLVGAGLARPANLLPVRHRLRLKGYDYGQPALYFVTICTERRRCLFGEVLGGLIIPNALGRTIEDAWADMPARFDHVELDSFVVMPNHMHGIVRLTGYGPSLSRIVGAFKSLSARAVNRNRTRDPIAVWQRGFHDHIIRVEPELERIRDYIANNPANWGHDRYNPANTGPCLC